MKAEIKPTPRSLTENIHMAMHNINLTEHVTSKVNNYLSPSRDLDPPCINNNAFMNIQELRTIEDDSE